MSNIFYHGSIWLFDEFDIEYSSHGGEIFVSPCHCKLNSKAYLTRNGGYLYTVEIPESNKNFRYSREWGNDNCLCRAYSDVSDFKILNVEKIEYDGKPMWELECGGVAIMMDRRFVDRNKQKEVV
jgi:hypothetical protein